MTRRLLAQTSVAIFAVLASACGKDSFPVTPTPVANSAVVVQGTKYRGSIALTSGSTTSFNMTLIARELSGVARVSTRAVGNPTVTGNFETGNGLTGTVQGKLTGSLDNGFFDGTLTATSGGRTAEQKYSGPITNTSAALLPGDCLQGSCAADGLTGAIQTFQTDSGGPPPAPCSYSISPTTASFSASGGTGSTTITTASTCAWAALPTATWIEIVGAATGTGAGSVSFRVQANPGDQRSGSLRIAGQVLNITEAAPTPPTITTQPQSQTIASGATATLSVAATGTDPLSYQWFVGPSGSTTNPIAGATASSYTTPSLTSTTSYWVRVSNATGSADSSTATITVTPPTTAPTITTQPQSQTIVSGRTATLSVTATGTTPLGYQWYVGPSGTTTSPIAGATASSYTTPALTSTTSYWVRVSNAGGSANSIAATITVTTAPAITTQPQSQTIASGATATMSVAATGTAPLSYQWHQGPSGTVNPIAGATATSYTTPALTSTTSYWVRVTNATGTADSTTAVITVNAAPTIGSFTASPTTITAGQSATLTWSGVTNATTCSINNGVGTVSCANGTANVTPTTTTTYTFTATGPGGSTPATATVTVNTPPPTIGSFTASPTTITAGQSATLAWSGVTNATTCSIDNGVGTVSCANGTATVTPATTTTYTFTATGPGGSTTRTATVTVTPAPTIGVSPLSGTRPITFTVTGAGFTVGGIADVTVIRTSTGGLEQQASATVNSSGQFTQTFDFLSTSQPGTFDVSATDRTTGTVSNVVRITVN